MLIGFKKKVFGKRLIALKTDLGFCWQRQAFYTFAFSWIICLRSWS